AQLRQIIAHNRRQRGGANSDVQLCHLAAENRAHRRPLSVPGLRTLLARQGLPPMMKLYLQRLVAQYNAYGLAPNSTIGVHISGLAEENKRHGYPLTMDYLRRLLGSCGVDQEAIEFIGERFAYDEEIVRQIKLPAQSR